MASILIGIILIAVALVLGLEARDLLLGASASPRDQQEIRGAIEGFPEVVTITELLTMRLGVGSLLVTGEINIKDGLSTNDIESLLQRITARIRGAVPEAHNIYLEPHPGSRRARSISQGAGHTGGA